MNGPVSNGGRYERRFPDPKQWPSSVVYGLYAEVKTEKVVNELSWEWAGNQVAAEADAFLRAEQARAERRAAARAEGFHQGEPGDPR